MSTDNNPCQARRATSCRFVDKVAIVTGSSSGLGLEAALRLAREGACVTLCGRDRERLVEALKQCQAEVETADDKRGLRVGSRDVSERFIMVCGDVTTSGVRKQIVDETITSFGRLDVLLCNAGVFSSDSSLTEATEQQFDQIMSTNVKANFFLVQTAAPHLETTRGSVIMVSSVLSRMIYPVATLYSASKAALDRITADLALTFAPKGVRVNSVNPSYIPTRLFRDLASGGRDDAVEDTARQHAAAIGPLHPLHGRCATPGEFADCVLFLASDESGYVTGQSLVLDAGASLVGAFTG